MKRLSCWIFDRQSWAVWFGTLPVKAQPQAMLHARSARRSTKTSSLTLEGNIRPEVTGRQRSRRGLLQTFALNHMLLQLEALPRE